MVDTVTLDPPVAVTPATTPDPAKGADTPAAATPSTVLDATEPKTPVQPDWPEDWRERMAGGDADELKRLGRYKSPIDVNKARSAAEKKISSGPAKLAADAAPEAVAAWRKDNGIPEKPDGYLAALPKGLVIGDADKPLVEGFLARAHAKNADPAVVADMMGWYYEQQEKLAADQSSLDKKQEQEGGDVLREEWGAEFRANINSVKAFLDTAPPLEDGTALSGLLIHARLPNGKMFMNEPAAVRWFARLANDANPAGFISPASGGSQVESMQTELDGINKVMSEKPKEYFKNEKMQARWRTLTEAIDKLSAK